ncbi:MAG: low specificity L-threonine aldolase [Candidatus Cloacimonadota bacterium]|nr:low specificity L-threonine aldolase [Candidatus Cloacimonadota bacterium]
MFRSFASDNNAGVHPLIMKAVSNVNIDHTIGYGDDKFTYKAIEDFKTIFGEDIDVYFVYNGTGANIIALQTLLNSFNSVICPETAHINVDECGAAEKFGVGKLIPIPTKLGKLDIKQIQAELGILGDEHHSQPKVIAITQATEFGTIYTVEELKTICDFAHKNGLFVHMDGARIANAAVTLGKTLKEITTDVGIDSLSFGGTKNGMMFGEAVVFFDKSLSQFTKFYRKQGMQLASKMRYISAQFSELLQNNLWEENAKKANNQAQKLLQALMSFHEIEIVYPVQTNGIFVKIPKDKIELICQESFFYVWDEENAIVRWMTSFDTTDEDIYNFIEILKKYLK